MMRAAFYHQQGPANEVLFVGELDTPEPSAGEVRVRVHASGVNPSDWKVRKGGFNRALVGPTIIPHSDGAGVIDAVGDGVSPARLGQRVWTWNAQWKRPFGTAAQHVVLPARQAVVLPDGVSFAEGACLGILALSAVHATQLGRIKPGMRVLITGGAGSVGRYAVQVAKAHGATVLTTVSSDAKVAIAKAAGADHVINYRTQDVGVSIRAATQGAGVDGVIEVNLSTNAEFYPSILQPRATVIVYGMARDTAALPSLWLMQNSVQLKFFLVYELTEDERANCINELEALLISGKLTHHIGMTLPLTETARAHNLVESGLVSGNVILDIA